MPPLLPTRPTQDITKISASWMQRLLDCVAYAMTHPAADGLTIRDNGGSHSVVRPYHNTATVAGGDIYGGFFNITTDGADVFIYDGYTDDAETETSAGSCTVNDKLFNIDSEILSLSAGINYIYLVATYEDGEVADPVFQASKIELEDGTDTAYFLLYRISVVDESITKTSREFHGMPRMILWGSCDA